MKEESKKINIYIWLVICSRRQFILYLFKKVLNLKNKDSISSYFSSTAFCGCVLMKTNYLVDSNIGFISRALIKGASCIKSANLLRCLRTQCLRLVLRRLLSFSIDTRAGIHRHQTKIKYRLSQLLKTINSINILHTVVLREQLSLF